jgi:NitT/TauT family transport system permease protein
MSRAVAIPLAFVIGVLALWQGLVVGLAIPEYLLPAPLVIVETLDRSLLTEIAYTAGEALCGFVIASGLAFAAAIAFVRFRTIEQGLFPFAITLPRSSRSRRCWCCGSGPAGGPRSPPPSSSRSSPCW